MSTTTDEPDAMPDSMPGSGWPMTIPYDLRCALESARDVRYSRSPQDDWAVIREWLVAHGVAAPDHELPTEPEKFGLLND